MQGPLYISQCTMTSMYITCDISRERLKQRLVTKLCRHKQRLVIKLCRLATKELRESISSRHQSMIMNCDIYHTDLRQNVLRVFCMFCNCLQILLDSSYQLETKKAITPVRTKMPLFGDHDQACYGNLCLTCRMEFAPPLQEQCSSLQAWQGSFSLKHSAWILRIHLQPGTRISPSNTICNTH